MAALGRVFGLHKRAQDGRHLFGGGTTGQAIEDVVALFVIGDQALSAQHGQLLGHIGLRLVERSRQMADALV